MRAAAILTLPVLATITGCTTSKPDPDSSWREHQRLRLERAYSPRTIAQAVAEAVALAPGIEPTSAEFQDPESPNAESQGTESQDTESPDTASQDPEPNEQETKHIDQRLPEPETRSRPFRHDWQPLAITLEYGRGDIMVRADGSRFNDRTNAAFAKARIDTGSGAALHAAWWGSDLDLFAGKFISDGVMPRRADAELDGADVFPHVRFQPDVGGASWSMPVRLGLFGDWQQLDHQTARVEREWLSFGPRLLIEPTWTMVDGENGDLQLFTRLGGDVGPAWFTEEYPSGDDRDVVPRWSGEIGGGLRGSYKSWHAELGYRLNHTTLGKTDGRLFGERGRTELQRQQVFLGIGYTY